MPSERMLQVSQIYSSPLSFLIRPQWFWVLRLHPRVLLDQGAFSFLFSWPPLIRSIGKESMVRPLSFTCWMSPHRSFPAYPIVFSPRCPNAEGLRRSGRSVTMLDGETGGNRAHGLTFLPLKLIGRVIHMLISHLRPSRRSSRSVSSSRSSHCCRCLTQMQKYQRRIQIF
jgi:hypothetical protein